MYLATHCAAAHESSLFNLLESVNVSKLQRQKFWLFTMFCVICCLKSNFKRSIHTCTLTHCPQLCFPNCWMLTRLVLLADGHFRHVIYWYAQAKLYCKARFYVGAGANCLPPNLGLAHPPKSDMKYCLTNSKHQHIHGSAKTNILWPSKYARHTAVGAHEVGTPRWADTLFCWKIKNSQ